MKSPALLPELAVKKMISTFSLSMLDRWPPFVILSTKALAEALETDPIALAMRRYRNVGPKAAPADWIKGHVTGFLVADARIWLGDPRSETEQFRAALGDTADSDAVVRMLTRARAQTETSIVGVTLTTKGYTAYLNYLHPML